jgi:hypothetical protein
METIMAETDGKVEEPEANGVDIEDNEDGGNVDDAENAARLEPKQRTDQRRAGQVKKLLCFCFQRHEINCR